MSINTSSTKRVDWRNYDYSEGPPKPQQTSTIASNPYEYSNPSPSSSRIHSNKTSSFSDGSSYYPKEQPTTSNDKGNKNDTALTYRPAKTITPKAIISDDEKEVDEEEQMMRIPKVKKYAENLLNENKKRPCNLGEDGEHYYHESEQHPFDQCHDDPPGAVGAAAASAAANRTKNSFEQVWQQEENQIGFQRSQRIVSDDDDDNDNTNKERKGKIKFETFAGDRSKGSDEEVEDSFSNHNGSGSDSDSVGKMDVPLANNPVSILKNSGKFDTRISSAASVCSIISNVSVRSSKSRRSSLDAVGATAQPPTQQQEKKQQQQPSIQSKDIMAQKLETLEKESAVNNIEDASMPQNELKSSIDNKSSIKQEKEDAKSLVENQEEDEDDDDTLFDFPKAEKKKVKRRKARMIHGEKENGDDDTSIEDSVKRADSLKDRAKQAWSVRNRASASTTQSNNTDNVEKREKVSFHNNTTVREFTPDSDEEEEEDSSVGESIYSEDASEYTEYTDFTENDDDTYAGRSMHSEYTKSNESETEDIIKDFFLIGRGRANNPGHRQLKYKKGRKEGYDEKIKQKKEEGNNESFSIDGSKENTDQQESELAQIYNLCEDGLRAFAEACGLFSIPAADFSEDNQDLSISQNITADEWFENVSKIMFQSDLNVNPSLGCTTSPMVYQEQQKEAIQKMALSAARIKHRLRQLQYDETQSMNWINDVKLVVVKVGIPIGVGFEENENGCAVQKIFENGNVHNTARGDKLEVGDHLTSINYTSVYKKNVSEMCKILAGSPNTDEIQLIFLRYVGPIRASNANEQQGYEVIDPDIDVSTKKHFPIKLSKTMSSLSQRRREQKTKNNATVIDLEDKEEGRLNEVKMNSPKKKKKRGFAFFRRKGSKSKNKASI